MVCHVCTEGQDTKPALLFLLIGFNTQDMTQFYNSK